MSEHLATVISCQSRSYEPRGSAGSAMCAVAGPCLWAALPAVRLSACVVTGEWSTVIDLDIVRWVTLWQCHYVEIHRSGGSHSRVCCVVISRFTIIDVRSCQNPAVSQHPAASVKRHRTEFSSETAQTSRRFVCEQFTQPFSRKNNVALAKQTPKRSTLLLPSGSLKKSLSNWLTSQWWSEKIRLLGHMKISGTYWKQWRSAFHCVPGTV